MFFSLMSAPIFGGDESYISVYKMVCVGFLVYKMVGPNVWPGVCSAIVGVLLHSAGTGGMATVQDLRPNGHCGRRIVYKMYVSRVCTYFTKMVPNQF